MGRRGPLPQPNNVRQLHGNPGKRTSKPPLVTSAGLPKPPSWITGEALREWKRIVPELDRLGLLSYLDRGLLANYCFVWEQFVNLGRILDRDGTIIEGKRGGEDVKHPAWVQYREATGLLLRLMKELGLTPASRLRMPNPFDPDDDDDDLDSLLS